MPSIWRQLGLDPKKQNEYTLTRLSPNVPVDQNKSLAGQNIAPTSTIVLKFLQVDQNSTGFSFYLQ